MIIIVCGSNVLTIQDNVYKEKKIIFHNCIDNSVIIRLDIEHLVAITNLVLSYSQVPMVLTSVCAFLCGKLVQATAVRTPPTTSVCSI